MENISEELGIPKKNLRCTQQDDRFVATVSKAWLKILVKNSKLSDFNGTEEKDDVRILLRVFAKCQDGKVIPLPRIRLDSKKNGPLSLHELFQYIHQTNYKNLWKEAYKKYNPIDVNKGTQILLTTYNEVLREIILRTYGCGIVDLCNGKSSNVDTTSSIECGNLLPVLCAVETYSSIYLIHYPYIEHTLKDCITFSPSILNMCYTKPLFIVYQLVQTMKQLHDNSLIMGEITLNDIYLEEDLWIFICPQLTSNIYMQQEIAVTSKTEIVNRFEKSWDKIQVPNNLPLEKICELWIGGQISNYTYLMVLNGLAGRRLGDPNCHYVFPWVTDFSERNGKNWRDLKKSKFRLNKGDRQLDLTYEHHIQTQPPHHVSDVLSAITYFVYTSRRTSKEVLCKNVRTVWVPAEYPSSIQRLQEWTPDECIPEFFSEPNVFKSIHPDLDDLEVPPWSTSPEDFIDKHREILESQHVSERLHHWIDLTFGYKLSGNAAIKAKNVCLHLVDDHTNLTTSGVVQLFVHPHPPRNATSLPFWGKSPPKLYVHKHHSKTRDRSSSSAASVLETTNIRSEEEDPHEDIRLLSRSRSSLNEEPKVRTHRSPSLNKSNTKTTILLPKEFNPAQALNQLENMHNFFTTTFQQQVKSNTALDSPSIKQILNPPLRNAFTNRFFEQSNNLVSNNKIANCNYTEIVAARRTRELQILGCLIVEIFMAKQMRVLNSADHCLKKRIRACLSVIQKEDLLPNCIKFIVRILLNPADCKSFPAVTEFGLPPPTAHLILEPLLHNHLMPFNEHFNALHSLIEELKDYDCVFRELDLFCCDGRHRGVFMQNVAECKVKSFARNFEASLSSGRRLSSKDGEVVNILVMHVKNLIEVQSTSVLAAWYLFDPLARLLGPQKSEEIFLGPVLKLYETYNAKIAKIYHHSFLLRLIVRFGLRCFLEYFIAPLVEAVGGYKDNYEGNSEASSESDDTENNRQHVQDCIFTFESDIVDQLESNSDSDITFNNSGADEAVDVAAVVINETNFDSASLGKGNKELCNISCDIGSKKSVKSNGSNENSRISSMSADSLDWLSHRLGPVLSARYLTRNLLKMLTLCYVGGENLQEVTSNENGDGGFIGIANSGCVLGDRNASKVMDCLCSIAALYGEQLILLQYLPHMAELILLCKRKLTPNLEGGLISCLALLKRIVPYMCDATLMDQLQDVILKNIIHPTVRLLGSIKYTFPNGCTARRILARKYLDTLYVLALRMGADMSRTQLAVPALQRFFLIFDKIDESNNPPSELQRSEANDSDQINNSFEESSYVELRRDGTTTEWAIGGRPVQILPIDDSEDSLSPVFNSSASMSEDSITNQALDELRMVFSAELAYTAYMPFLKLLGFQAMESSLKNHTSVYNLCQKFEEKLKQSRNLDALPSKPTIVVVSGSLGSNVSLVGNRIDVQEDEEDVLNFISNKMENSVRHLRGNWLAYWEHEIGRSDKDNSFNFKQIKLQTFTGHVNSVKAIHVLDNENSFLSCSRDKTVKLWSLRSQGTGSNVTNCQSTYACHKKGVLSLAFLESLRLVASCDGVVQLWDPFMCSTVAQLEPTSKCSSPVNIIKSLAAPSPILFAATADATLRIIDARLCAYSYELKVCIGPVSLIRCMAVAPSGLWIAVGQASGQITILDTRTGLVLQTWRGHEGEVLQLEAIDEQTLVSSSLDQTITVWSVTDGRLKFHIKGCSEPVHCLNVYNNEELITGSSSPRIGVYMGISEDAHYSSTKLRSDTFKGLLTSMALLPLNRLLLLGSDNGNISLLC
ncbi:PREDICTED: WD repeat-containing protein 81 [Nicrophorus vespilloides]|uniref:WD repeat-containing protein 81 n=1 Tax=Nicrophorus vespilloides TaxID=110193 RepID=A0ABM1NIK6_NICVS|nr:PREDICTED: WD repeat-containing protein 81 [Nicrophorus vespilloides]